MQWKKLMTPEVERLPKDANIHEAAWKMKALEVGMIPVYDGDRLVEMVTDRDTTLRVVAEGRDAASTPAHTVMTPEIIYRWKTSRSLRSSMTTPRCLSAPAAAEHIR